MRCARQRWRAEREHFSIALMTPGAPSDAAGADRPARGRACPGRMRSPFRRPPWRPPSDAAAPDRPSSCSPRPPSPARGAGRTDTLGDAVDEEVDDLVLAQVAAGEVLVVGPELLAEFQDGGCATTAAGRSRRGRRPRCRGPKPAASGSTASPSQRLGPTLQVARISERNGSSRPTTWGAAKSIRPSAVFRQPVRTPLR